MVHRPWLGRDTWGKNVAEQDKPQTLPKLLYPLQMAPWRFNDEGDLAKPDPGLELVREQRAISTVMYKWVLHF